MTLMSMARMIKSLAFSRQQTVRQTFLQRAAQSSTKTDQNPPGNGEHLLPCGKKEVTSRGNVPHLNPPQKKNNFQLKPS